MWDLSSQPGIEPVPPAVGAWGLNCWTTKEAPWSAYWYIVFGKQLRNSSASQCDGVWRWALWEVIGVILSHEGGSLHNRILVQSLGHAQLFSTSWLQHARLLCPSLSPRVCSDSCPSCRWCCLTILWCPLLLLPSIFLSIRVFSNKSALCIRWPKYYSFSISPSNERSRLISFRVDWFDLPAVQGTLKSFFQYRSSKASILQCSAFFMVQLHVHTRLPEKP